MVVSRILYFVSNRRLTKQAHVIESGVRTPLADFYSTLLEGGCKPSGQTMPEGLKFRQWKGRRPTVGKMTFQGTIDQPIPPNPVADLSCKPPCEVHPYANVSIRPKPDAAHGKTGGTQLTTCHPQMVGIFIGKEVDGFQHDRPREAQPP